MSQDAWAVDTRSRARGDEQLDEQRKWKVVVHVLERCVVTAWAFQRQGLSTIE